MMVSCFIQIFPTKKLDGDDKIFFGRVTKICLAQTQFLVVCTTPLVFFLFSKYFNFIVATI